MSREVLLMKSDVCISFGNIDIKSGITQEDVDRKLEEINTIKMGAKERLLGRIEGALQALGCDDDRIGSFIEQINEDIEIIEDYSNTEAYLAKISELLADGWIVEVYD